MDKCPKCGGKAKVLERSSEYWGGVHCIAEEENCHSAQQLKAEIALFANDIELDSEKGITIQAEVVINKLRQLSAV